MKAKILLAIFLVFVLASFVSAIPKDFEVSNVFWAAEGTMKDSEGFDKPFLLGLVELSWETDKGKTNSPVVYLDYNGGKYYSYSLGLIKGVDENSSSLDLIKYLNEVTRGILEAQFYPIENYASDEVVDKISKYTLFIPISQNGEIDFEKVRFSKLNQDLIIQDSFRAEDSDAGNLFPDMKNLVTCAKSIDWLSSSTEMCDDDKMSIKEFEKCIEENKKIDSITFECSVLCLKNFYIESFNEESQNFGDCSIYNINFVKVTSKSLDFNELTQLNNNLEQFNPWRAGP
ncbi:MAG TPA: hypothetical protein VJA86_02595 [Candidatus Nanoarchaeia archaeon]|nr:hypothetical protein [Candidatus Nanoarchaeia archaeon]